MPVFEILEESIAHKRFLKFWHRKVRFEDGRVIDWDVVGGEKHNPTYCIVFPYHSATNTVTIIQEYHQGPNKLMYGFAAGAYEKSKHSSILETAKSELSEEMMLTGGTWFPLLPEGNEGISELKWCTNTFIPFLVVDPVVDDNPKHQDNEEYIIIERNVSIEKLKELILEGKVSMPSVQTTLMAFNKLSISF